jgi:hypothetical protein
MHKSWKRIATLAIGRSSSYAARVLGTVTGVTPIEQWQRINNHLHYINSSVEDIMHSIAPCTHMTL